MTREQYAALKEIRRLMYEAMDDYLRRHNDGHKSSECSISVSYPNHFEFPSDLMESDGLEIYSYALGPYRQHTFAKGSPRRNSAGVYYSDDPFATALFTVRKWHERQLAREFAGDPPDDDRYEPPNPAESGAADGGDGVPVHSSPATDEPYSTQIPGRTPK
jgi:hypothetical protein